MPPDRINEGVELLESKRLIDVRHWAGTLPFSFSGVELTAEGRVRYEESIENRGATMGSPASSSGATARKGRHRVFVVHGQDEAPKNAVQIFLRKLDLEDIVLHEQPNRGRTIIEKFESYAAVDFALVLLTPDDTGGPVGTSPDKLKRRARQNVVLELGYFIGKLGRDHVCALHQGDVEIPSDLSGMLWVEMDRGGAWKISVANEMQEAGIPVDLNKLC